MVEKEKSEKVFHAGTKKVEIYSSGDSYEGEINSEGKRHGFGVYTTARYEFGSDNVFSGDVYIGYFKNGIREGQGVYTSKDGSRYEGEFKNGKPNGNK